MKLPCNFQSMLKGMSALGITATFALSQSCAPSSSGEVQQGGGGSSSGIAGNPIDVAEPVPMGLLPLASVSSKFSSNYACTGARGSYSDSSAGGISDAINPLDTSFDAAYIPKNFAISFNILQIPGYAQGEMRTLLDAIASLSEQVFGADGFFKAKNIAARSDIMHYQLTTGSDISRPKYAEVVIADRTAKIYEVGLFYPNSAGTFDRRTWLTFRPKRPGASYALIHIKHSVEVSSGSWQHLEADYDTELNEIVAVFGRSPSAGATPATTKIRMQITSDELFVVQGAYTWNIGTAADEPSSPAAPFYYQPNTADVALFESVASCEGDSEAVQRVAYAPHADGAASITASTDSTWGVEGNGYTSDLSRYVVDIVRNPLFNPGCSTMGSTVKAAAWGGSVPTNMQSIPANLCESNTSATDAQVNSLMIAACQETGIGITLNVNDEDMTVDLCRKYMEAYLLRNNQYIQVSTAADGTKARELVIDYPDDQTLFSNLVNWEAPSGVFATLEGQLEDLPAQSLTGIVDKAWPEIVNKAASAFSNAATSAEVMD